MRFVVATSIDFFGWFFPSIFVLLSLFLLFAPAILFLMFRWFGRRNEILASFTDKGIQAVKDTTKRAAAAKEIAKKFGVNMREIYWTTGDCDMVCVLEADDEKSLAAFSLATAMQGNVRAASAVGQGTTFVVTLPRAQTAVQARPREGGSAPASGPA